MLLFGSFSEPSRTCLVVGPSLLRGEVSKPDQRLWIMPLSRRVLIPSWAYMPPKTFPYLENVAVEYNSFSTCIQDTRGHPAVHWMYSNVHSWTRSPKQYSHFSLIMHAKHFRNWKNLILKKPASWPMSQKYCWQSPPVLRRQRNPRQVSVWIWPYPGNSSLNVRKLLSFCPLILPIDGEYQRVWHSIAEWPFFVPWLP